MKIKNKIKEKKKIKPSSIFTTLIFQYLIMTYYISVKFLLDFILIFLLELKIVNSIYFYFISYFRLRISSQSLLLFLLPPSCMVVPIRNIANKLFFSHQNPNLSTINYSQTLSLPTMLPYSMGIDIQSGPAPNNFDEVRGRTLSSNKSISRDVSMSSTKSLVVYHKRMTTNNANNNNNPVDASPELSYETEQKKALCVSNAADQQDTMRTTGNNNKTSTIYGTHEESIINIQLPYNPQAPTKPDL